MAAKPLRIIPLGGLGEVGKNMTAIEYGENILLIDAGIMFPENDMLGIDYIIPDFNYLLDKKDIVRGLIITHGHEDHTGAISHVLQEINVPVYATRLSHGLIGNKLKRAGIQQDVEAITINAGDKIVIGPFEVEFFHVAHSIPDGVGLGITTPAGLIVHSGDFKFDHTPIDGWPTDLAKLAEFGGRGVLALLADSTNADRPGWTPSERMIDSGLDQVFLSAKGRILIGTFASLISRMAQVAEAAQRHGRKMAFVGTSMVENARIARELGYLNIPDSLIVPLEKTFKMKPEKVVLMCTGTQGEPSSILGRLSRGDNRQFDLLAGDTVVLSSHPIPGNEEMVHRTINRLIQRGAEVIYDAIAPVHVSGHASQEEMRLLHQIVRPEFFIPVHGELRHLKMHARLAMESGIPEDHIAVVENGTPIEFRNGAMSIGERIPGGYVFVDGSGVGDVGPAVMRERESLSRDGLVAIHAKFNPQNGAVAEVEFSSKGFVFMRDAEDLFADAEEHLRELLKRGNGRESPSVVEREMSRYFYSKTRRRPVVVVFIS
jgi:ribonuclease J